jgi:hypothetical protein
VREDLKAAYVDEGPGKKMAQAIVAKRKRDTRQMK